MANEIDGIVTVTIDANTASPLGESFGKLLIVGFHTRFPERVREYTSLAGMIADGFATTDAMYRAVQTAFSQSPRPASVLVGRLTTGSVQLQTLTPIVQNNRTYSMNIDGFPVSFTSDATATNLEIVAGLAAAINATAVQVTATGTTSLILTADTAGDVFFVEYPAADWTSQNTTPDTSGIAAQIAAIQGENDTWYAVAMDSWGRAEVSALAAYIETQKKIFVAVTSDSDVIAAGTGDISSALKALNYDNTSLWFSRNPHQYLNVAIAASMLTTQPGSATWKFKTLEGVSADAYTPTELGRLQSKNANHYITAAGVSYTAEGVASGGEFIDTVVFIDWLANEIQIAIFTSLLNLPKVPLTDPGIAVVENALRGALMRGAAAGGIDGSDPSAVVVVVPKARALSPADRAARRLTGVTWSAPLAGAAHSVVVAGNLV